MPNKIALFSAVGPELTRYEVDVDGAALTARESIMLPANIHYVVPHGAHPNPPRLGERPHGVRPVVLTWGLLGPGKGIEAGIDAMAELRDIIPQPRYVVAGDRLAVLEDHGMLPTGQGCQEVLGDLVPGAGFGHLHAAQTDQG